MLTSVGTLCACIAISAAPAAAPTANKTSANKSSTPAAAKPAQPAAAPQKRTTTPATAIPNAAAQKPVASSSAPGGQKPVANGAVTPQPETQQRVANKPVAPDVLPLENAVIQRTNQERVRRGLRPLAIDFGLLASARKHAAWMTRRHSLQHTNQPVAENIAMGQNSSDEVVRDWMSSPGHRANILNASYSRIGVAAYTSTSGTVYWCQQFLQ